MAETNSASKQAIDASRFSGFYLDPEDITLIRDKTHPLYDPRVDLALDEGMVKNMMAEGVLVPVSVAKIGGQVICVDGRQRVKHALEANKRLKETGKEPLRLRCVMQSGDEMRLLGVAIAVNEIRRNDEILQKAEKSRRYISMGRTDEEAALAFGVSITTIKNWQKLDSVIANVRKAVEAGQISVMAAVKLADLDKDKQQQALEELQASGNGRKVTVRAASRKAKAKKSGGSEDDVAERPSMRLLGKIAKDERLPADARVALQWVTGQISELSAKRQIENLPEVLKEIREGK